MGIITHWPHRSVCGWPHAGRHLYTVSALTCWGLLELRFQGWALGVPRWTHLVLDRISYTCSPSGVVSTLGIVQTWEEDFDGIGDVTERLEDEPNIHAFVSFLLLGLGRTELDSS